MMITRCHPHTSRLLNYMYIVLGIQTSKNTCTVILAKAKRHRQHGQWIEESLRTDRRTK